MSAFVQDFTWHAADREGRYEYGRDGYLVMDGGATSGIACSRRLASPITDQLGAVAVRLRVVVGKRYEIRLLDGDGRAVVVCRVAADGWIRFAGSSGDIGSGRFLTWFRGRPCVDPVFVPWTDPRTRKTVESDEHRFEISTVDFGARSCAFTLDDHPPVAVKDAVLSCSGAIARLELVADPSDEPGNRIRLRSYEELLGGQITLREDFPTYWEPIAAVPGGYPDDNTLEAVTRPAEHRWLECSGAYCWVKARLPLKLAAGELGFDLSTPDVQKEACLELHEHDGTMSQSTWPIKMGILQGRFFSGFASLVPSHVLGGAYWQSQQAWYDGVVPQPDRPYRIRVEWTEAGRYRWWVDDVPMRFSGVAKTGRAFVFPDLAVPGPEIPFTNPAVRPAFGGIDTIALHYGLVTPAPHRARYGRFRMRGRPTARP